MADVFACGVLLFTMLTGASPFANAPSEARSSSSQPLPGTSASLSFEWPRDCLPSLSCQDLVEKMLEADPLKRITVDEVLRHAWYQCDLPRELQVRASICSCVVAARCGRMACLHACTWLPVAHIVAGLCIAVCMQCAQALGRAGVLVAWLGVTCSRARAGRRARPVDLPDAAVRAA